MMSKPSPCRGCPLDEEGKGFCCPAHVAPRSTRIISTDKLWLGEAPGRHEIEHEPPEPFIGPAGYEREKALAAAGSARHEWYTTNVLKCQPPPAWTNPATRARYGPLLARAIHHCTSAYLTRELSIAKPKVVVLCGGIALWWYVGIELQRDSKGRCTRPNITQWRSTVLTHREWSEAWFTNGEAPRLLGGEESVTRLPITFPDNTIVIPTIHPAWIIRGQWHQRPAFKNDVTKAVDCSRAGPPERALMGLTVRSVYTPEELTAAIAGDYKRVVVDVETARENQAAMFMLGLQLDGGPIISVGWEPRMRVALDKLLSQPIHKVAHNLTYERDTFLLNGVRFEPPYDDTMIAAHVEQPDVEVGLDDCSARYLPDHIQWKGLVTNEALQRIWKAVMGLDASFCRWWTLYNAIDIHTTGMLDKVIRQLLHYTGRRRVYERDMEVLPKCWAMRDNGMRPDLEGMRKKEDELVDTLSQLTAEVDEAVEVDWYERFTYELNTQQTVALLPFCEKHPSYNGIRLMGRKKCEWCAEAAEKNNALRLEYRRVQPKIAKYEKGFSPLSDADWRWILYEVRGYKSRRRTDGGERAVDKFTILELKSKHDDPLLNLRLRISDVNKQLSTYLQPYTEKESKRLDADGVAHASYMLQVAGTRRISSSDKEEE